MGRDEGTYESVMVGVAVGDALGYLAEHSWPPPEKEWLEDLDTYLRRWYRGGKLAYSDDTEMSIFLAETLIESCGFDPELFMHKVAEGAELYYRFYGSGTSAVVNAVRSGTHWSVAARSLFGGKGNYGNGAAMRVAPISLFYTRREEVEYFAEAQAVTTHTHPLAIEGARLIALAIHYGLEGVGPDGLLDKLVADTQHPHYLGKLKAIKHLLGADPVKVVKALGNDVAAHESVPAAIYSHIRGGGDPLKTLLTALSLGGDIDTIAAMALPITAAYAGNLSGIPREIINKVEDIEQIAWYGRELLNASRECSERAH